MRIPRYNTNVNKLQPFQKINHIFKFQKATQIMILDLIRKVKSLTFSIFLNDFDWKCVIEIEVDFVYCVEIVL